MLCTCACACSGGKDTVGTRNDRLNGALFISAVACRFGNRVLNPLSQVAFGADGSGPGRLSASVVRASDAELAVHYSADVAGRYSLVVRCSSTGEVVSLVQSSLKHTSVPFHNFGSCHWYTQS